MEDSRERVLVTGAAGYVAGLIMPTLREHYALRRLDVVESPDRSAATGESARSREP